MYKLISIVIFAILIVSCNTSITKPARETVTLRDHTKTETKITVNHPVVLEANPVQKEIETLPIHGQISREELTQYFYGVTDTIKDLRIIGAEKVNLNPGDGILVSILHNTGTFDQMIVCTHDSTLTLIDNFYIGKAKMFDKSSHTIEYEIIDKSNLRFTHVDWGYVEKDEKLDIDTVKHQSYSIYINEFGTIKYTEP